MPITRKIRGLMLLLLRRSLVSTAEFNVYLTRVTLYYLVVGNHRRDMLTRSSVRYFVRSPNGLIVTEC